MPEGPAGGRQPREKRYRKQPRAGEKQPCLDPVQGDPNRPLLRSVRVVLPISSADSQRRVLAQLLRISPAHAVRKRRNARTARTANCDGWSPSITRTRPLYVEGELKEAETGTTRLCFEIEDSHQIQEWDRACTFVATVKNLGCDVALDGFGLGTHSFQLLKKLHVDYLKISEGFVSEVTHNSVDYEVVLGLSRIAKALKIRTIAGGVGSLATRDILRGMGIDFAQGYLLEPPPALSTVPTMN
ncbi:MAG: EAL domain-containing protein [Gammaproteobacteria bacterium]|nr:EAL domain-containing protein [Gammaproteobacteria bacterium]